VPVVLDGPDADADPDAILAEVTTRGSARCASSPSGKFSKYCHSNSLLPIVLGSVDESPEPDEGTGEVDERQEARGVLVEAGEDAAEVLQFADEAFDEMDVSEVRRCLVGTVGCW